MNLFAYRVSWSQLAWFGHRASGLGVLFYLFMHIVETSMVLLGPEVYNAAVGIFKNLPARIGEVVLMAAVVYHALNGLRVIAMDFFPGLTIYYRPLTYGVIVATVISMVPLGLIMLRPFMPWGS
jgi:succinate dehydrogenase / fumarate reductase, cytochrome b subunit